MLNTKKIPAIITIVIGLLAASCGEYEKLLKSRDYDLKYKKALEYYHTKEYAKAGTIIEQILPRFRATRKADSLLYYQAYCSYYQEDFVLAGHYFRNFTKTYNNSIFSEESDFMGGYCYYKMSPKAILDQTSSYNAINALKIFMVKYPKSNKINECENIIKELRNKLVNKSYISAKLYYDLEEYKAAIVALRSSLKDYPNTKHREEIMYLVLKSSYLLAKNSIVEKQVERYQSAVDEYYSFVSEFPNSEHKKEAENIFTKSRKFINKN